MAAQDDDLKTDTEIQERAMKALTEVIGGDKDGNLTKALELRLNKIKDPHISQVIAVNRLYSTTSILSISGLWRSSRCVWQA